MKTKIITLALAGIAFYACTETTEVIPEENLIMEEVETVVKESSNNKNELIIEELETIVEHGDHLKSDIAVNQLIEVVEIEEATRDINLQEIKDSEVEIIEVIEEIEPIEVVEEKEVSIIEVVEDNSNN